MGEFARKAGVSVRTVRYYDHVGLLKPAGYTPAGRRLYDEAAFARLQQILTLKLIGLSLDEIATVLATESSIAALLERQRQALQRQVSHLQTIIETIERAQTAMQSGDAPTLERFVEIIQAVNMNADTDWFGQFLTGEQREKLAAQIAQQPLDKAKAAGKAWQALFQEILVHMDDDVRSAEAQQLVDRWDRLIALYGGDDAVPGLNAAYRKLDTVPDVDTLPPDLVGWTQSLARAARFIERARTARQERH
ncbi:MAG: MerR family transcriptional regulator [Chloroflexota bacterium]